MNLEALEKVIAKLERLLASDRTEIIVYRAELERQLERLKALRDASTQ